MCKERLLIESFEEESFQNSLGSIRLDIEKELKKFIEWLKVDLTHELRIFDNIESRIKSRKSFSEKIRRKDYINLWDVSTDSKHNQKTICNQLPDLIGYRINCFFFEDENTIYEYLKKYDEESKFSNKISLVFPEKNENQKNGHLIYKLTGLYDDTYNFEIQVKSLFHNIWGEVEHKTIYKGRCFDPNEESRKNITGEIFNVLKASDKQLLVMYKNNQKEKQLIRALFYHRTEISMKEEFNTDILAKHYNNYFDIFNDEYEFKKVKEYVADSMLDVTYNKKSCSYDTEGESILKLANMIKETFLSYEIKFLHKLTYIVNDIPEYDSFLKYLAAYLIKNSDFDTDDYEFKYNCDSFSEEEDTTDLLNSIIAHLSTYLEKRK